MKPNVGIIGGGFVGAAHAHVLRQADYHAFVHDINPHYHRNFPDYSLPPNASLEFIADKCPYILITLPTPPELYLDDGQCRGCNTDIIYMTLTKLFKKLDYKGTVCIKSTVTPGYTKFLAEKFGRDLYMSPEFLTEADPIGTLRFASRIVIGKTDNLVIDKKLLQIFTDINDNPDVKIIICDSTEAEIIKLMSNCMLMSKVVLSNLFYDVCKTCEVDYNVVREAVGLDPRIGPSHMLVPGPDGKRGAGKSCFPKDIGNVIMFCKKFGINCELLETISKMNVVYRGEADWVNNKYRESE